MTNVFKATRAPTRPRSTRWPKRSRKRARARRSTPTFLTAGVAEGPPPVLKIGPFLTRVLSRAGRAVQASNEHQPAEGLDRRITDAERQKGCCSGAMAKAKRGKRRIFPCRPS